MLAPAYALKYDPAAGLDQVCITRTREGKIWIVVGFPLRGPWTE
jgi:hypothetical protein